MMKSNFCIRVFARWNLKIIPFFIMILCVANIYSQVTIGSNVTPEKGAIIDIKQKDSNPDPLNRVEGDLENSTKGLLIPRVYLIKYDSLAPLYTSPPATDVEKLKATGMVVYNLNRSLIAGIEDGFVQWNGKEWTAYSGGAALSDFSIIDCDSITVNGYYSKMSPLSSMSHTLTVPVDVKRSGHYNIYANAINPVTMTSAGYSFATGGEFSYHGKTVLTLYGEGMPLASTTDNGGIEDIIEFVISNYDTLRCPSVPSIYVYKASASLSFSCSAVKIYGTEPGKVAVGTPLDPNMQFIMLDISSSQANGEYDIYTETVNGISFKDTGILTGATQTVILKGSGVPLKSGSYTYAIKSNSVTPTANCFVTVDVP
ncbi:MAG: hypothetical protein LBH32_05500 [Dysgonamonadaceae bacterium]|jgi:hypothetical protein|nr:hypothetical protein [Dysgonamonadaceae bacterium]